MTPETSQNIDKLTVQGFGEEWHAFDQSELPDAEARAHFDAYFAPFRWDLVNASSTGFDMGCGSGRWAKILAPRVGHLHCIDPSTALNVARRNLAELPNISFHRAAVDPVPLPPSSMDFGISLGVLHHIPDTGAAIKSCAALLKPGAPLLLYLYYRFDNQPAWYRLLWEASELGRGIISRLPQGPRVFVTSLIAALVYWPLARLAGLLAALGINAKSLPLSYYRGAGFYTMRTDALDRFGTRLEQRFTRAEISTMLTAAGCGDIRFSDKTPYWCVCAVRNG
jgi:SAM-dependent methyltransferase